MVFEKPTKETLYTYHHFNTIEQILQDYQDSGIVPERDLSPHIYEAQVFGWFYEVTRGAFDAENWFFRDFSHAVHAKNFADKLENHELSLAFENFLDGLNKLSAADIASLDYFHTEQHSQLHVLRLKIEELVSSDVEHGDYGSFRHGPLFQAAENHAKETCPIEVLADDEYRIRLDEELARIDS